MKDQVNDGGPAFPVSENYDERRGETITYASEGMSLRDYFAAKADVSVYDPVATYVAANGSRPTVGQLAEYVASIRLAEADAMLRARGAQ